MSRIKNFYDYLLAIFVRANFNYKYYKFNKLYDFNPAIFFNDTVSTEITIDGIYEKKQLELLSNILDKKNQIFIDVGANIGNHTLYYRNRFKKVYSFEPHPKTYKLLKFNTEDFPNIKTFNFGISNKKKKIKMSFNSTGNVAGQSFKKAQNKGKVVLFKRFDDLYNFKNTIGFIKIDVEGNELDVLKSMKKNLKNNSPIISLEFDAKNFSNNNEIIIFLKKEGFKKFYFYKTNKPLNSKLRYIFVNFFKIIFMNYKTKIELLDLEFFDNNTFYSSDNIIISKKEIKNFR